MSTADAVLSARVGEVLVLTLNRPEKANAMSGAMHDALVQELATGAKAVVITGAGTRVFCAGADLKEFSELDKSTAAKKRRALLRRTLNAVLDFPGPLVAAVQGKALGAGAMLALLADDLVMADTAEIGLPEIKHGIPTPVGYAIVVARSGMAVARRMVQEGELAGPGLADFVCAADAVEATALQRAGKLAALPPDAYRTNKNFINASLKAALAAAFAEADKA